MATLHWKLRDYAKELRPDGRLTLLTMLLLHTNVRLRCWPGMDLIAEESGWSLPSITEAKEWLINHKAIELVPYDKRIGEECKLPVRQHVYQLTGVIEINGEMQPYLYVPESDVKVSETSNVQLSEVSPSLTKGITDSKDNTESTSGAPLETVNRESDSQPTVEQHKSEVEQTTLFKENKEDSQTERKAQTQHHSTIKQDSKPRARATPPPPKGEAWHAMKRMVWWLMLKKTDATDEQPTGSDTILATKMLNRVLDKDNYPDTTPDEMKAFCRDYQKSDKYKIKSPDKFVSAFGEFIVPYRKEKLQELTETQVPVDDLSWAYNSDDPVAKVRVQIEETMKAKYDHAH